MPYLAQGDLQLPQEVVITQVDGFVVDVIDPKYQLLHHFEIVVDDKLLGKLGIEAILDLLRARHLLGSTFATVPHTRVCSRFKTRASQQLSINCVHIREAAHIRD